FYSDRDGSDFAIYVMNANGSGVVRLTSTTVHHELPAWSPDGQYIAFDSDADLHMMKADGTGLRRLTSGNETDVMAHRKTGTTVTPARTSSRSRWYRTRCRSAGSRAASPTGYDTPRCR